MADPHFVPIDSNGNLTTKVEGSDTWAYEWNARNQLTRVTKNSAEQARFSYDPLGRRVEKVAGGVTTTYVYDGEDILQEIRGGTTLRHIHGPGIDEPLARDVGGSLSYFHADGLGSIVKTTSATGTATLTRQYDAWGNLELAVSEPGYAFTGREWDSETGLYYYRARYHDPKAGRFISEDPIGLSAGPNFYAYVGNSPVNWSDPLGLRMRSTVNIDPPRFNQPKTCIGSPGATCYAPLRTKTSPCVERPCGKWGFDAHVALTIHQEFSVPPTTPSGDTPGKNVQQHEDLHVDDFYRDFRPRVIEQEVRTEGFPSKAACELARGLFSINMDIYLLMSASHSHTSRDVLR